VPTSWFCRERRSAGPKIDRNFGAGRAHRAGHAEALGELRDDLPALHEKVPTAQGDVSDDDRLTVPRVYSFQVSAIGNRKRSLPAAPSQQGSG
jgi:hypothetical protein